MKKQILLLILILLSGSIYSQEQSMQYGYCTETIANSLGVGVRTDVKVAIKIPAATATQFADNRITAVKIGAGESIANNAKLFIMNKLGSETIYEQDIELIPSVWNEIALDSPYVIENDKDIYIGYSFTSGTGKNIYSVGIDDSAESNINGGFICYKKAAATSFTKWEHISNLGAETNLTLTAVIEGDNLPQHDLRFISMALPISASNPGELVAIAELWNVAATTITNFDIEYSINNGEIETISVDNVEIPNYQRHIVNIPISRAIDEGSFSLKVNISKLNGKDDEDDSNNSQTGNFIISKMPSSPTIVSIKPSKRNVLLEEFTGVNCLYCSDGHKIANKIATNNPGRVNVINIHQGGFAVSTPDYRTKWGDAIAGQSGLSGYPSGTVNRHIFSGQSTALDRMQFESKTNQLLNEESYINIASKATIDKDSRELIVDVELYYTGDSPITENLLNVALLQDSIMGEQKGGSSYYPEMMIDGKYQHNHMLRDLLTEQWGDIIRDTKEGTYHSKRYFYSIPARINNVPVDMDKLSVIAFVAEGRQEIITSTSSEMIYLGSTDIEHLAADETINIYPNPTSNQISISGAEIAKIEIYSMTGQLIDILPMPQQSIELGSYPEGIYLLRIQLQDGRYETKRLILNSNVLVSH